MAVLSKLEDVYAALDLAVDGMDAGDEKDTVEKIVTKLKNRRVQLHELLTMRDDKTVKTYAAGDAQAFDHLG